jgi:magnesium-transporting ATPase (P-type)
MSRCVHKEGLILLLVWFATSHAYLLLPIVLLCILMVVVGAVVVCLSVSKAIMREIVDKHFPDNWVIAYYMGYTVDLSVQVQYCLSRCTVFSLVICQPHSLCHSGHLITLHVLR